MKMFFSSRSSFLLRFLCSVDFAFVAGWEMEHLSLSFWMRLFQFEEIKDFSVIRMCTSNTFSITHMSTPTRLLRSSILCLFRSCLCDGKRTKFRLGWWEWANGEILRFLNRGSNGWRWENFLVKLTLLTKAQFIHSSTSGWSFAVNSAFGMFRMFGAMNKQAYYSWFLFIPFDISDEICFVCLRKFHKERPKRLNLKNDSQRFKLFSVFDICLVEMLPEALNIKHNEAYPIFFLSILPCLLSAKYHRKTFHLL